MTHHHQLLSAFLDGETTDDEAAEVVRHLESCGPCRVELEDLASARAAVRGLPLLELPDGIGPAPDRVVVRMRRRRVAGVAVATVAAVVTVVVGLTYATAPTASIDPDVASSILAAESSLPVSAAPDSVVGGYMVDAADARFTARQTTSCLTPDGVVDSMVDVTQVDAFTIVSDPLGDVTVVTPGTVTTGAPAGPLVATAVDGAGLTLDTGYEVTAVEPSDVRGRPVEVVTVGKAGIDRVVWTVDAETRAILGRETLAADGHVVCRSELVEFQPIDRGIEASVPFTPAAQVTTNTYGAVVTDLPDTLGGLTRTATYQVEAGVVSIYSDGLLTAAVGVVEGVPDHVSAEIGRPGQTANIWQSDGTGYAVFGVLPDDVLDAVLADLPAPAPANPVVAWFRRLFD